MIMIRFEVALLSVALLLLLMFMPAYAAGGASLFGNYSDRAVDINKDGLYDQLIVEVVLKVEASGEYSIDANLYDREDREVVWSVDHRNLSAGEQKMELEFDGKTIEKSGLDGPYRLKDVTLTRGSASTGLEICQYVPWAYTTGVYDSGEFADPASTSKMISGKGRGELLLKLGIKTTVPVFEGKYSYDIVGLNIPPLDTPYEVKGSKTGYAYSMPGIYLPRKPNDFIVTVLGAKDLSVGLKKLQGERTRIWVSSQVQADEKGNATLMSDLISPFGSYHVKILGEARDNATQVELLMTAVKKLVIDGEFVLGINTTGFPEGNYSLQAEAINGSFSLDALRWMG
jgi:hypothetical protein